MSMQEADVVFHKDLTLRQIKALYVNKGFETEWILQTHRGDTPTVAKSIGFAFNFPEYQRLTRWNHSSNSYVLRIHVEILTWDDGTLVSYPHVEVDPRFHKLRHIASAIRREEVRGEIAVSILRRFFAL